jgi:CheY-like chemotaxis protein
MTPNPAPSRVLVAAQDGPGRDRILGVLEELAAEVTAVKTLPEMFDVLGKLVVEHRPPPDAVLVGELTQGQGLDALRILRRSGWTTPFVLVDRRHEAEARALGAVVLGEPFDADELKRALRGWLEETGPWRPGDLGLDLGAEPPKRKASR